MIKGGVTIFKKKKKNEEVTEGKATETETATATATVAETESVSYDTKSASKIDLRSTLVMVVVAVISVLCSFIFVTRFYSSKDVYDLTNVADASVAGKTDTSNVPEEEIGANTEMKEGAEKAEGESGSSKSKNTEKKDNTGNSKISKGILDKILVPMDSIVVNLGKVDSKRYLRVIISLEVSSSETENTIKKNKVIFRDKLVSFLSTKNADDIGTSASQLVLRTEIKDLLNNELLGVDAISQVYFSDFIIQ